MMKYQIAPTKRASGGENLRNAGKARHGSEPVPVEVTIYRWKPDLRLRGVSNKFGTSPATPIRFQCLGTLSQKFPKRYRVELASAMDRLPDLSRLELKGLVYSLALAIALSLGVDVAPIPVDVIDFTDY